MTTLKFVFLGLLVLSAVNAEFLFEKNVAADDKFMCLHKKLYRNEKPANLQKNPARILSLRRTLQDISQSTDQVNLINYLNLQGTLQFNPINGFSDKIAAALAPKNSLYFRSDQFKIMVRDSVNSVYNNKNQPSIDVMSSTDTISLIVAEVQNRLNKMLALIGNARINQATSDGISKDRIIYLMLNIMGLFVDDKVVALKAYDDYYSSNVNQISGSAFNSEAMVRWIESIKKRFVEIKIIPDPDRERILEPWTKEGFSKTETPAGNYLEKIPSPDLPNPTEFEEPEPKNVVYPKTNEDIIIKDMLIEIQRSYNVQKMLLTYNQLTKSLKEDIDSCKLNLKAAIARCEKFHGANACEAISSTMVAKKCPAGYSREGATRCVVDCPAAGFITTNRSFCEMTDVLHVIPSIISASAITSGMNTVPGLNLAVGSCQDGFTLNKFICYRNCPAGTRSIGASTCLKEGVIDLGAPFQWAAGDE